MVATGDMQLEPKMGHWMRVAPTAPFAEAWKFGKQNIGCTPICLTANCV